MVRNSSDWNKEDMEELCGSCKTLARVTEPSIDELTSKEIINNRTVRVGMVYAVDSGQRLHRSNVGRAVVAISRLDLLTTIQLDLLVLTINILSKSIGYLFRLQFRLNCMTLRYRYVRRLIK